MQGAGFDARLSSDIELEMWEKWLLLASLGAITCTMRGSIGDVVAAPGGLAFIEAVLAEVAATIAAVGRRPREAVLAGVRTSLTTPGSAQTSSMFRDLQNGQPIEADQIIGDLLVRADRARVPVPMLRSAYTHLSVYQQHLQPS
jgi:2-dehydropantoate 2-reductase